MYIEHPLPNVCVYNRENKIINEISIYGFSQDHVLYPLSFSPTAGGTTPYKIVRSAESANNKILLFLRGYGDEEKFMSLLFLPERLLQAFRDAKRLNIEKRRGCRMNVKVFWLHYF